MIEHVILVDKLDQEIGLMEKIEAHKKGLLHRAISVFIFNDKEELLIQRRALGKYHSPGLWSNAACTHPRLNESPLKAAQRRLEEEMGIKTELSFKFKLIYKAFLDSNLIEHELDYVFCGYSNKIPKINTDEVCDYRYINKQNLELELKKSPEIYTKWFKICYKQALKNLEQKKILDVF